MTNKPTYDELVAAYEEIAPAAINMYLHFQHLMSPGDQHGRGCLTDRAQEMLDRLESEEETDA